MTAMTFQTSRCTHVSGAGNYWGTPAKMENARFFRCGVFGGRGSREVVGQVHLGVSTKSLLLGEGFRDHPAYLCARLPSTPHHGAAFIIGVRSVTSGLNTAPRSATSGHTLSRSDARVKVRSFCVLVWPGIP